MLKSISKSGVKQKVCTGGYKRCGGGGGEWVTHLNEMEAEVADWWSCFPLKQSFPLCLLLHPSPPPPPPTLDMRLHFNSTLLSILERRAAGAWMFLWDV